MRKGKEREETVESERLRHFEDRISADVHGAVEDIVRGESRLTTLLNGADTGDRWV